MRTSTRSAHASGTPSTPTSPPLERRASQGRGTATLARAVSIVTELAGVALSDVRRVAGRFGAMVALGSHIEVRLLALDDAGIGFDVLEQGGRRAISGGLLQLSE